MASNLFYHTRMREKRHNQWNSLVVGWCSQHWNVVDTLISSVAWSTLFRLTFPVQSDQAIRSKYGTAHLNTTPNCPVVRLHNFWDMAGCWTKSVN